MNSLLCKNESLTASIKTRWIKVMKTLPFFFFFCDFQEHLIHESFEVSKQIILFLRALFLKSFNCLIWMLFRIFTLIINKIAAEFTSRNFSSNKLFSNYELNYFPATPFKDWKHILKMTFIASNLSNRLGLFLLIWQER